jgi:hypothetical protein
MATVDRALLERTLAPRTALRPAPPKPRKPAATKPELNRQERVISAAYLAMIVTIVAFMAATGLVAWLGT